jgi:hypothetical protein
MSRRPAANHAVIDPAFLLRNVGFFRCRALFAPGSSNRERRMTAAIVPLPKPQPLTLSAVLAHSGLPDTPPALVEAHRNHRHGLWRIKFSYDDGEPLSMDPAQATMLAGHLRHIGESDLAGEVETALGQAERFRKM